MIFWEIRKTAEGKWKTNGINWSLTPILRDHTTCLYESITSNWSARTIHLRLPESFISLYFSNIRQANSDNHYFTFDRNIGNYVFVRNWPLLSLSEYFSFVVYWKPRGVKSEKCLVWELFFFKKFAWRATALPHTTWLRQAGLYLTQPGVSSPRRRGPTPHLGHAVERTLFTGVFASWPWACENGRASQTPLIHNVIAWMRKRRLPSLTPHHLQHVGDWPKPLPAAALRRTGPAPCLGSKVDLTM